MKRILLSIIVLCFALTVAACAPSGNEKGRAGLEQYAKKHEHQYSDATCLTPATCACGAVKGEALGHDWMPATCIAPATCRRCTQTQGEKGTHQFRNASYSETRVCIYCSETQAPVFDLGQAGNVCLAEGTDEHGDFFALVARENEDYTGTTIEVGIIKNNAWLVELSSQHPFVAEDGFLRGHLTLDDLSWPPVYVGNACFFYDGVVYNSITQKAFDCEDTIYSVISDFGTASGNQRDDVLLMRSSDGYLCCLNTKTMQVKQTSIEIQGKICAYHEGLFYMNKGFYSLNGDKVIDLSMYYIIDERGLVFDSTCQLDIKNDQGTIYQIEIDREGTVIHSQKQGW